MNNLLAVIIGNAGLAERKLSSKPATVGVYLEKVIQAGENAALLCKQMLAYSGKGHFIVEPVDVSCLLSDIAELLEVSIDKRVGIAYHIAERLPLIEADIAQLQQVMMNLVINASEAIGEQGGEINISSGMMDADVDYLNSCVHENVMPGSFVYIEVCDTGCGMDDETVQKIFNPFFTTKFTGRGLGMSAMLGIIRGHHGAIHIDSKVDEGSTIRVLFPSLHSYAEDKGTVASPVLEKPSFKGTVLVVDDEEAVMEMAVVMLEDFGFHVLTAVNGQEAVTVYGEQVKRGNEIQFVLLDLTMPVMGGKQACAELFAIDQDVQILISSGYSENDVRDRLEGKKIAGFIQKPYSPEILEEILRTKLS